MKSLISLIYVISHLTFLVSCVGTVQSVDPISTKVSTSNDSTLNNFSGLQSATAISNSKVELFFSPILTNLDKYSYIVTYDGLQIPIYISASSLENDYRGLVKYTVTGLDSNKKYTFQVQVRDIQSQAESANNIKMSATTFANLTANFSGISEARNLSGSAGLTGVEIVWPEAEVKGSEVFKNEIDPIEYKITLIDSSLISPGNMNDPSFIEPARKIISAAGNKRNLVVNGLKSNTKYYVQVRAVHHGYTANSANAAYKTEENSNYLEVTTYSEDLANLNFDTNSFYLSLPPGPGGLYALNGNWIMPVGNFDSFRIYYAKDGSANINGFLNTQDVDFLCMGSETNNPNIFCEETTSNKITMTLTGLEPNVLYNAILAVCMSQACERSKRVISSTESRTTTPTVANFQGITTIDTSNDVSNLNTLTLNFLAPDFSTGNISGFIVDYYGNNPNSLTPIALNDSLVTNTTTLTVDEFEYATATSITIRGIDYTSTDQQCFMVYPFTYSSGGAKIYSKASLTPTCVTPILKGPTALQFEGFTSTPLACDIDFKLVNLTWDTPTKGVHDKFEIFYIKSETENFSFSNAVMYESNPDYHRVLLDEGTTTYTLSNMATGPGAVYKIGILSFYDSPTSAVRSDFNIKTITCDFR